MVIIKNESIQCKDCINRYEKTVVECEIYILKPDFVLEGEKECPYYEKDGSILLQ